MGNDVVAAGTKRENSGGNCAHARAEGKRILRSLKFGYCFFKRSNSWVAITRIIARLVSGERMFIAVI